MSCQQVKLSDGSVALVKLAAGKKLTEADRRQLEEFRAELEQYATEWQRDRNRKTK